MPGFLIAGQKLIDQGRANNSLNGGDAESYAMAKIILACRGEGQWGSRQDDNMKIDLIFTAPHPWCEGERMLILFQVKSGTSYGETLGDRAGFKLKTAAKLAAKRTSHDICVVWVDRDLNRAFWAYVHPNTKSGVQIYGANHELDPAIIFDLARCMADRGRGGSDGGRGVTLANNIADFQNRRSSALKSYRATGAVNTSHLGPIEFTRIGWRHMFRRSRNSSNKNSSINFIPSLPSVLKTRPSSLSIESIRFNLIDDYMTRNCEYLLKYNKLLVNNNQGGAREVVGHVRVLEEIQYPREWDKMAMLSQSVRRRVVLKSAYYKYK